MPPSLSGSGSGLWLLLVPSSQSRGGSPVGRPSGPPQQSTVQPHDGIPPAFIPRFNAILYPSVTSLLTKTRCVSTDSLVLSPGCSLHSPVSVSGSLTICFSLPILDPF